IHLYAGGAQTRSPGSGRGSRGSGIGASRLADWEATRVSVRAGGQSNVPFFLQHLPVKRSTILRLLPTREESLDGGGLYGTGLSGRHGAAGFHGVNSMGCLADSLWRTGYRIAVPRSGGG